MSYYTHVKLPHGFVANESYRGVNSPKLFLYVMQSGDCFKVGIASDLNRRIKELRAGNPHHLECVMYRQVYAAFARRSEQMIHDLLSEHAIGREWFRCDIQQIKRAFYEVHLLCEQARRVFDRELQLGIRMGSENERAKSVNVHSYLPQ